MSFWRTTDGPSGADCWRGTFPNRSVPVSAHLPQERIAIKSQKAPAVKWLTQIERPDQMPCKVNARRSSLSCNRARSIGALLYVDLRSSRPICPDAHRLGLQRFGWVTHDVRSLAKRAT